MIILMIWKSYKQFSRFQWFQFCFLNVLPSSGKNFHKDPAIRFFDVQQVDAKKVQQRNPNGFIYPSKETKRLPLVCSYLVPGFCWYFLSRKKQANAAEERAAAAAEWKLKGFWGAKFSRSSVGKNVDPRRNTPLKFNMLHLKISPWKMSCLFWKPSFSPKCIWTLPRKSVGWKTSLSYWVSGTCQGLTVKLRGVHSIKSTWNTKKWRFGIWFSLC